MESNNLKYVFCPDKKKRNYFCSVTSFIQMSIKCQKWLLVNLCYFNTSSKFSLTVRLIALDNLKPFLNKTIKFVTYRFVNGKLWSTSDFQNYNYSIIISWLNFFSQKQSISINLIINIELDFSQICKIILKQCNIKKFTMNQSYNLVFWKQKNTKP